MVEWMGWSDCAEERAPPVRKIQEVGVDVTGPLFALTVYVD